MINDWLDDDILDEGSDGSFFHFDSESDTPSPGVEKRKKISHRWIWAGVAAGVVALLVIGGRLAAGLHPVSTATPLTSPSTILSPGGVTLTAAPGHATTAPSGVGLTQAPATWTAVPLPSSLTSGTSVQSVMGRAAGITAMNWVTAQGADPTSQEAQSWLQANSNLSSILTVRRSGPTWVISAIGYSSPLTPTVHGQGLAGCTVQPTGNSLASWGTTCPATGNLPAGCSSSGSTVQCPAPGPEFAKGSPSITMPVTVYWVDATGGPARDASAVVTIAFTGTGLYVVNQSAITYRPATPGSLSWQIFKNPGVTR